MKSSSLLVSVILILPILAGTGCKKKDDNKQVLSNSYAGVITFEYSRGFPSFTAVSTLNVTMGKDGVLTSGTYEPDSFDEEAIKYEGTKPVMKLHVVGTVTFDAAQGNYALIDGADKLLIYLHSVIEGTMEIYGWDDDLGFILVTTQDFIYTDEFSDGTWEFDLTDAVLDGSKIIVTFPDIEGTSTYGYTVMLVPSL
jgi:hypothetical protein